MSIGYRIGTSGGGVGGLAYLEDLIGVIPYPTPYKPWSTVYDIINGQTYGDGFPEVEWRFRWMTAADMAVMLGYVGSGVQSAQVYIATKNDLDVFANYSAYIHRPNYPQQGSRMPGRYWRDVLFRFTMLESA